MATNLSRLSGDRGRGSQGRLWVRQGARRLSNSGAVLLSSIGKDVEREARSVKMWR